MDDAVKLISRILLSAVFILYGYLAFSDINAWLNTNQAALNRFMGMIAGGGPAPTWLGYVIATIQLVGGLAILVGFKTRWVAFAFAAYLILIVFFAHNFWDMTGPARGANQAHFYKNLAIMGGYLLLGLVGAGRYSIDNRMPNAT